MTRALGLAFIGSLIAWDNIAIGQFAIAPPAVSAVLMGFLVGDVPLGIWSALTFQLLWSGRLPVGAYVPPNAAVTGITAVGLAAPAVHPGVPLATRAVLAGVIALWAGVLAGRGDVAVKKANVSSLRYAERGLDAGNEQALRCGVLQGAARFFFKDFVIIFATYILGWPLLKVVTPLLSIMGTMPFAFAFAAAPGVGIGAAVASLRTKRDGFSFALGIAVAGGIAGVYWLCRI